MASKRIANGTDDKGSFIETRTQTKQSHFFVDMRLYSLSCDLSAGPP